MVVDQYSFFFFNKINSFSKNASHACVLFHETFVSVSYPCVCQDVKCISYSKSEPRSFEAHCCLPCIIENVMKYCAAPYAPDICLCEALETPKAREMTNLKYPQKSYLYLIKMHWNSIIENQWWKSWLEFYFPTCSTPGEHLSLPDTALGAFIYVTLLNTTIDS